MRINKIKNLEFDKKILTESIESLIKENIKLRKKLKGLKNKSNGKFKNRY